MNHILSLTPTELDILITAVRKEGSHELNQFTQSLKTGINSIPIDAADEIRDACADHLTLMGFDQDYRITDEGAVLETLIDKLYVG